MEKFLSFIVIFLISVSFVFISCEKEDYSEMGRQAAREFCDCRYDGGTMEECEDLTREKYTNYQITHDDFVEAFNDEGSVCGVTLTIE